MTVCGDGLKPWWTNQHILVNPPYKDAMTWVQKGVEEATTFCALLRLGFLSSKGRKAFWDANPPTDIVILSQRPSFISSGKCDSADYAWMVWEKSPRRDRHGHAAPIFHPLPKLLGTRIRWISK